MKDENDQGTLEIFPEKKKFLKGSKGAFYRLHVNKLIKGNKTLKGTVSIEQMSYQLLACKLKVSPYTREANKTMSSWLEQQMRQDPAYDTDDMSFFSTWMKKVIVQKIASKQLRNKVLGEQIEREKALGIED